jgi:hypothetical protein
MVGRLPVIPERPGSNPAANRDPESRRRSAARPAAYIVTGEHRSFDIEFVLEADDAALSKVPDKGIGQLGLASVAESLRVFSFRTV